MRYSVFNSRGKWQASYSHKFPNMPLKSIKGWAIQTAKLCGGKVYERIIPSDKRYEPKDHLLFDFTNYRSKLKDDQPNSYNKYNKDNNKIDNKKDKE